MSSISYPSITCQGVWIVGPNGNRRKAVNADREMVEDAILSGNVKTGSEWDGWNAEAIYDALCPRMSNVDDAAAHTDWIIENRRYMLRQGLAAVVVDKLDLLEIPVYEWGRVVQ